MVINKYLSRRYLVLCIMRRVSQWTRDSARQLAGNTSEARRLALLPPSLLRMLEPVTALLVLIQRSHQHKHPCRPSGGTSRRIFFWPRSSTESLKSCPASSYRKTIRVAFKYLKAPFKLLEYILAQADIIRLSRADSRPF